MENMGCRYKLGILRTDSHEPVEFYTSSYELVGGCVRIFGHIAHKPGRGRVIVEQTWAIIPLHMIREIQIIEYMGNKKGVGAT